MLFVAVSVMPFDVFAQSVGNSSTSLGVSPAIIEKVLDFKKPLSGKLDVFNLTNLPLPVKAFVTSFSPKELSDIPEDKRKIYDASSWITIDEPDFILQPKTNRTVDYTIKAPKGAEPGGHYATIFFQPLVPEQALSPQNLYIVGRIGALVFLTVPGDIRQEAKIKELTVPSFSQFGPAIINLKISNTGNIQIRPTGKVEVLDFRGQVVFSKALNEGLVIPGTTKTYEFEFGNKGTVGQFRARASIVFGEDQEKLTAENVSFWILPYIPIGGLLLIVLIFLFIFVKLRRRIILAVKILLGREVTVKRTRLRRGSWKKIVLK